MFARNTLKNVNLTPTGSNCKPVRTKIQTRQNYLARLHALIALRSVKGKTVHVLCMKILSASTEGFPCSPKLA